MQIYQAIYCMWQWIVVWVTSGLPLNKFHWKAEETAKGHSKWAYSFSKKALNLVVNFVKRSLLKIVQNVIECVFKQNPTFYFYILTEKEILHREISEFCFFAPESPPALVAQVVPLHQWFRYFAKQNMILYLIFNEIHITV